MRKGNVKILLLMLFVLAGLALIFMLSLKPGNLADKTAQAQEIPEQLAQMETRERTQRTQEQRRAYSQSLSEFRNKVNNLEQRDMARFRTQTSQAFMELANLIDEYRGEEGAETGGAAETREDSRGIGGPGKVDEAREGEDTRGFGDPGKVDETEREGTRTDRAADTNGLGEADTDEIRESARKIATIEDEDELVRELKNGFDTSKEALEEAQEEQEGNGLLGNGNEQNGQNEDRFEQSIEDIEEDIDEINKQNYKAKTKELFTDFYEALNYLNTQQATTR